MECLQRKHKKLGTKRKRDGRNRKKADPIVLSIWEVIKIAAVECSHAMVATERAPKELYMKVERSPYS